MKLSRWFLAVLASCLIGLPAFAQTAAPEQTFSKVEVAIAEEISEEVFTNLTQHEESNTLSETEKQIIQELDAYFQELESFSSKLQLPSEDELSNMSFEQMMEFSMKQAEEINNITLKFAAKLSPLFISAQTKYTESQINKEAVTAVINQQLQMFLVSMQMESMFGGMLN